MPLTRQQKRSGSALLTTQPTIERGIITHVYPKSLACDVVITGNKLLRGLALPNYVQFPNSLCAQVELPVVGTPVLVQTGTQKPAIIGYCNLPSSSNPDGEYDGSPANFRTTLPGDLLPGDWLRMGDRGQYIGVFGPGLIKLDSGNPWCSFILSQEDTTTVLTSRRLEFNTAAGKLLFDDTNDNQAISFQFGTNSKTETFDQNWRYWGNLDGAGFRFSITDTSGNATYSHSIDLSGNVNKTTHGTVTISSAGKTEEINGDFSLSVYGAGKVNFAALQARVRETTTFSTNDFTLNAFSNLGLLANRDVIITSGRTMNFSAAGATPAIPGAAAVQWNVSNGSFNVDVGMPGPDLGTALSGINMNVYSPGGNIKMQSLLGKIMLESTLPDSILLGSNAGVAVSHVVKWELGLQPFLMALIAWLDSHVHADSYTPPLVPSSSVLSSLLLAIPSVRVKVGL